MRILFFMMVAVLGLTAMAGKPPAPAENPDYNVEANRQIVMGLFQTLFVEHKVDEAIDKYIDPNYIQHNPLGADGAETIRGLFKAWFQANPSQQAILKRMVCEKDLCAVHYHGRANDQDRGSAVVDIFRISKGKIVEHWDVIQAVPEKSANNNTMF